MWFPVVVHTRTFRRTVRLAVGVHGRILGRAMSLVVWVPGGLFGRTMCFAVGIHGSLFRRTLCLTVGIMTLLESIGSRKARHIGFGHVVMMRMLGSSNVRMMRVDMVGVAMVWVRTPASRTHTIG